MKKTFKWFLFITGIILLFPIIFFIGIPMIVIGCFQKELEVLENDIRMDKK